jgi:AMP-binding enzyme
MLSYAHGVGEEPLLGETIGANLERTIARGLERAVFFETPAWDQIASGGAPVDDVRAVLRELQFDDPINIQYTSGTTGFPKGSTLTHHNILNNARSLALLLRYDERDRVCICARPRSRSSASARRRRSPRRSRSTDQLPRSRLAIPSITALDAPYGGRRRLTPSPDSARISRTVAPAGHAATSHDSSSLSSYLK